jgi:hypothetical protein
MTMLVTGAAQMFFGNTLKQRLPLSFAVVLVLLTCVSPARLSYAQAIIAWSAGPLDARPAHNSPSYIAKNIDWIEARPFDGMVINEFLGRNLFNLELRKVAPDSVEQGGDAISYPGALKSLAPLKGIFKVFKHNFVKVNMAMTAVPPPLNDDAGWAVIAKNARNYSRAVAETGLRGIMFDNETYIRPKYEKKQLDYWNYDDHLLLAGIPAASLSLEKLVGLARMRGRQFMQALVAENPALVLIIAHGPYMGCTSAKDALWSTGRDKYLMGAFAAGMVEATPPTSKIIDGGELYDLRTNHDFVVSREWRKGSPKSGSYSITDLDPRLKCPFMDTRLASIWPNKVSIAFGTFDKKRQSRQSNDWRKDTDAANFTNTLKNALRNADDYVWHYTEWQDWWGMTTEKELSPFLAAIAQAKLEVKTELKR